MVWWVKDQGVEKRVTPPASHQISDVEAMVDAAARGLGLAQLPLSMVRQHLGDGRLRSVLDAYAGSRIDIHAIWPKRAHLSPRVR